MAEFRIDQVSTGAGVPGRTRHDLAPGEAITLVATSPVGAGVTYAWEILDKVGSVAVLSSPTGDTVQIGTGPDIVRPCSFRIRLTVNDNGVITTTTRRASVRTASTSLFVPLFPEAALSSGTLGSHNADLSEDNAIYSNRAGLGVADQNWRGWAEWAYEVVNAVEAASSLTGVAGGDLSGSYPNPLVTKLRGREIENVAPANNSYLRWDATATLWRPTAFPTSLPPSGTAGGDLSGTYPNPAVARIQGVAVSGTAPGSGQYLRFNGSEWAPTTVSIVTDHGGLSGLGDDDHPQYLLIDGTRAMTGKLQGIAGTAISPAFSVGASANTGMYEHAPGFLGFGTAGVLRLLVSSTAIAAQGVPYTAPAGSTAAPAYGLSGGGGSGMYLVSGTEMGFSVVGAKQIGVTTTATTFSGLVRTANGAALTPAWAFADEVATGLYKPSTSQISIALAGSQKFTFSGNYLYANQSLGGLSSLATNNAIGILTVVSNNTTGIGLLISNSSTFSAVSGDQSHVEIRTTINQAASTAGFSGLKINLTNTALGSGAQYFADFQVAGTTVAAITNGTTAATQGRVLAGYGATATPGIGWFGDDTVGFVRTGLGSMGIIAQSSERWRFEGGTMYAMGASQAIRQNVANGNLILYGNITSATDDRAGIIINNLNNMSGASGSARHLLVQNNVNQSGTAGYTVLDVMAVETGTGSGAKYLLHAKAGVAGTDSRWALMNDGQVRFSDGTAAAPALTFLAQTNIGFYRSGTSGLALAVAGAAAWQWAQTRMTAVGSTSPDIGSSTSTAARLSIFGSLTSNVTDPSLTLYNFFTWSGTAAGTQRAVKIQNTVNQVVSSSGFTALEIATTETSLGSGTQSMISAKGGAAGTTEVWAVRNNGQTQGPLTAATAPTYSFLGDPTTGIFHPTGQAVGVSSFGTEMLRMTANGSSAPQILLATGVSPTTNPHYSFLSATDTGMTLEGNAISFYVDGVRTLSLNYFSASTWARAEIETGTAAAPSLVFTAATTTGLFSPGGAILGITTDGVERARFTATNSTLTGSWLPSADNTHNLGAYGQRWAYVIAHNADINTTLSVGTSLLIPHGTLLAPAIAFTANTDTGIISPNALAPGVPGILFVVDGAFAGGYIDEGTGAQFRTTAGLIGTPALSIDQGTQGFYSPGGGVTSAVAEGVEVFRWQAPAGANPQLLVASGLIATPGIGFTADPDSGIRWQSAGTFSLVSNGTDSLAIGPTTITSARVVSIPVGAVGAVGLYFSTETTTGWYRSAANTWAMSVSGSQRWAFSGDNFTSPRTAPIINVSGTNGAMTYRGNITTGASSAAHMFQNGTAGTTAFGNAAAGTQVLLRADATVNHTLATAGLGFSLIEGNLTATSLSGLGTYSLLDLRVGGTSMTRVTTAGAVLTASGSAVAPAHSFLSDAATGSYLKSTGIMGVGSAGLEVFAVGALDVGTVAVSPLKTSVYLGMPQAHGTYGPWAGVTSYAFYADVGTAGLPTYSFDDGVSTTGIFKGNAVAISHAGVKVADFDGSKTSSLGTILDGIVFSPSISTSGAGSGYNAVVINVTESLATGTGAKSLLDLRYATAARLKVLTNGQVLGVAGTAANPTFTSAAAPIAGLFFPSGGVVGVAVGGAEGFRISDDDGEVLSQYNHRTVSLGSAGTPAYGIGTASGIVGIYSQSSEFLDFSVDGQAFVHMSAADVAFYPENDNAITLGAAGKRWSDVFAVQTTIGDLNMKDPNGGRPHVKIVEGEGTLHVYDIRNGKKYRVPLVEDEMSEEDMQVIARERARWPEYAEAV